MTQPIRDRRPTEADADPHGWVEHWFDGRWARIPHCNVNAGNWWRPIDQTPPPEPEPDLLEFIDDVEDLCERVLVFLNNKNHLPLNLSRSYSTVAGQVSAVRIEIEEMKEKYEALEAAMSDEEAAHQETLSQLGDLQDRYAQVYDDAGKFEEISKLVDKGPDVDEAGIRRWSAAWRQLEDAKR